MAAARRIGILTGGGDVPGLNSVIKSVTYRATELDMEAIGIRRGWEGLTHVRPSGGAADPDYIRPLDRGNTRTIDRTGGTILHTSRTNPATMKRSTLPSWMDDAAAERYRVDEDLFDLTPLVLEHLDALGIDVLVSIGGDDTLSFSRFEAASISTRSIARPSRIATQEGHASHGSPSRRSVQLIAFARIRASEVLPVPRGPTNRIACATRPVRTAFRSVSTTAS